MNGCRGCTSGCSVKSDVHWILGSHVDLGIQCKALEKEGNPMKDLKKLLELHRAIVAENERKLTEWKEREAA